MTDKDGGPAFEAVPLHNENAWRVRNTFDGQSEAFRVSKGQAEAIASRLNANAMLQQRETKNDG